MSQAGARQQAMLERMTDAQLARLAATLLFIFLGPRAVRALRAAPLAEAEPGAVA